MPCYILGLRKRTTSSYYMCYTFWAFVAHLHIASLVVSVRVLFWFYNFVGTNCWYSSNSPAMVFVGASCHLYKQRKQSTRSVSIHRVFPCDFWSLIVSIRLAFIMYCIIFRPYHLGCLSYYDSEDVWMPYGSLSSLRGASNGTQVALRLTTL